MFVRSPWSAAPHRGLRDVTRLESPDGLGYTQSVTTTELRQLLRGSAFRPFTVYAEGKAFHVPHPEFAMLTPQGRTLVVMHKDDDALDLLDVSLIARAEIHELTRTAPQ